MYFKRIELNGFKSFADPVTIEFTDGITCIVGPNGSGKSNISDAIRWVLGEQSPKTLRGGKMEEVIFAGTQNRKPKGMAEVTLVIDNANHSLPIDFAEVGITRRMYRSGESEYMINRTPCRLKDIRELIMDTGIGVEGYSVIGQGKISDIIDNKMDSRREIFEEAAGVVKYRSRKVEAERKLSGAELSLDRVNDIVSEIEGRIGGLKRDSEKASEYLEIRDKYRDVEINITLKNIDAAEEKNRASEAELQELSLAAAAAENTRDALGVKLRDTKEAADALEQRIGSGRDALIGINDEIARLTGSFELNKEKKASLERDLDRLAEEMDILGEKTKREQGNLDEIVALRKESSKLREKLEKDLKEKEDKVRSLAKAVDELTDMTEEHKNRIFEASSEYASAFAGRQSLQDLTQTLLARKERLLQDEGSSKEGARILADRIETLSAKIRTVSETLSEYRQKADLAGKDHKEAVRVQAQASLALEDLRVAAGKISARDKLLEELESSYEGYSGGVRFLMKQDLPGMVGVLGDLITVPAGWETAIETELGNKLQNIVCETDKNAKQAIALLKLHQAGRVTFLPLGSLKVQETEGGDRFRGAKGFLGIASEEVTGPAGCEKVIEYLLGRVVIVDNIDNALEMSSKNHGPFRFVTLEGDIINAAGAITGGSVKSSTGNILSRKTERKKLAQEADAVSAKIGKAEEEKKTAEDRISSLTVLIKDLEGALAEQEKQLALAQAEQKQSEELLGESRLDEQRRADELRDIAGETAKNEEKIKAIDSQLLLIQKKKEEAQRLSMEYGEKLEAAKQSFETARDEETKARLSGGSIAERIKAGAQLEERARQQLEALLKEKEKYKNNVEQTETLLSNIQSDEEIQRGIEQKTAEKQQLQERLDQLSQEKKRVMASVSSIEAERSAMEKELYEQQMKKHEADLRKARFEAQSEALKEKLWEEFEMSYAQAKEHAIADFVMSRALKESREYKERLRQLGDVNVGAIEEYRQVKERYDFLTAQRADILKAMDELKTVIKDMDATIKVRFKKSFDEVVSNFEFIFSQLFNGGNARLTLLDPQDPLASGVEIEAQPPGKKLQNLNLLSGGEKTMTAIALMFAVLKTKPTPFCILDEVEAALDDANIDRFAGYLKNFKETQFALITHQKATMEHAGSLYGVTMPEYGVTKVLSLKLGDHFEME